MADAADESSSSVQNKPPGITPSDEFNANLATDTVQEDVPAVVKDTDLANVVLDGKNKLTLGCNHCPSKILLPGMAVYVKEDKNLPKMNQKKNCPEVEVDLISEWFVIDDMFQFENIGVSHSVQNSRYLTCADCEMGPVGWNDLTSQKCYIALSRVKQS